MAPGSALGSQPSMLQRMTANWAVFLMMSRRAAWQVSGGECANLQAEVAVAPRFLEFVVGEVAHFLQVFRLFVFEAEAVVKKAAADADGNCQSVGAELFAEDAAARRRELVVAVLVFAALGEEFDAGGQGAEQVFKLFGVFGGNVKGTHDAEELVWCDDACLMLAVTRIGQLGMLVVLGLGGGFALFLRQNNRQRRWRRRQGQF